MSRWFALASMLLLFAGRPDSSRAQSDGWGAPGGVTPAGWHTSGGYAQGLPPGYSPTPYGPPGPYATGPGRTVYHELPDDTGWLYEDTPLERSLKDVFRHAYFRVDYLLWDISDPGDNLLGSNTAFTTALPDPTVPFQVTDPATGTLLDVVAPSLDGIFTNENNGIRATVGFSVFDSGTFEASLFALQTSTATVANPDIRGFATIDLDGDGIADTDANGNTITVSENIIDAMVQSTLIDGLVPPGNNFFLIYDQGYAASLKTQVWGTEGNWIMAPFDPNAPSSVMPMLGFRYVNFTEDLRQGGSYTFSQVDPITGVLSSQVVERRIDATTNNNLYGPQIGLRAELRHKRVTLGVQPKVMLGLNSYKAELTTRQILSPTDPSQDLAKHTTTFGITGDVEAYTRLHVTDHITLNVGYNFLWLGLITRPADNIVYNVQRSPRQSNFGLDPAYSGAILQGLSVGGEVRW
jgi:hypothetical protein